ncbi:MAG: type II toxin-antitoxin system RelE/ParE family toxin [Verrucomicrobiota bacterium]
MPACGFHPEALLEYADATDYYLREASAGVAEAFIAAVESAVDSVLAAPNRWRVVEEPGIRRYVFDRFPYVIYCRWEADQDRVTIYAVMHCSREPGYWKPRVV